MTGFESLIKNDSGTWTMTGPLRSNSPRAAGTLILTGNNAGFTGEHRRSRRHAGGAGPEPAADRHRQRLVRFAQPDAAPTPASSPDRRVEKTEDGVSDPDRGRHLLRRHIPQRGHDRVASRLPRSEPPAALTFNGGTLRSPRFDLPRPRRHAEPARRTIDTPGLHHHDRQGITGPGGLTKQGRGTLILNGINPYAGGTRVARGTLAVGDADYQDATLSGGGPIRVGVSGTLGGYGSVTGPVTNSGTIAVADAVTAFAGGPEGISRSTAH